MNLPFKFGAVVALLKMFGFNNEQGFQNNRGRHEIHRRLICLVLEISILLPFVHSKLSNKVIFPQPGLLYSLVIFENDVLCRKTDLVIYHLKSQNNSESPEREAS